MAKTLQQIISDAKAGKLAPVYLFSGEEGYYLDQLSDYFENNIVEEAYRDFDQMVVYGRDTNMLSVIAAAQQMPMMSPRRLVLVKEAQGLRKDEWETLAHYCERPNPCTTLVFVYRNGCFDKRLKAAKAVEKVGVVFERKKVQEREAAEEVLKWVSEAGFRITEKAAMLLTTYLGTDLAKIANELSKLCILLKPGDTISESTIESNVGISKKYNVYELQNAIGNKDAALCTRIVNHFSANPKDNPLQLVTSVLYNYIVNLMIYLQLEDKSKDAASKALGINPFFVRDFATAAPNYSLGKLASCIGYLYDTDLRSKGIRNSGTITDGELLKELVFKIIH
ncbi:MAG: DNA polymerase III subunit delta [Bacteroidales bacterium]|nr:DNA polymerase III subunit delta [Bacteroidales bacterium]